MLNLKKGLALVLAAATAFTFAPVANLGNAVDANAAPILDYNKTEVNLQVNETRTFDLADLKNENWASDQIANVKVEIGDDSVATAEFNKDKRGAATWDNNTTSGAGLYTGVLKNGAWDTAKAQSFIIKGLKDGKTTITLSASNDSGVTVAKESITVYVNDKVANLTFDKDKVEFAKVAKDDYRMADNSATYVNTVTLVNPDSKGVNGHKAELKSSDEKVATVGFDSSDSDAPKTGPDDKVKVLVTPKGVGTATIDVTVKYIDSNSAEHYEVSSSFTVVVSDSTDTLSVKYDPSRTGKNTEASLTTTPDAKVSDLAGTGKSVYANGKWNDADVVADRPANTDIADSVLLSNTPTLYLDSISNTTAKLDISDSMGRTYTVSSSANWIAVDNAGNVVVSDPAQGKVGGGESNWGYVTVSVPKTTVSNKTVAGLSIRIEVVVYNKDTTSLKVTEASNQKYLGKTVGGVYGTDNFDDDEVVYLSTKDKTSTDLSFETNAGTQYITGVATTNGQLSDVVSYSNGKLTALKSGDAIVTITCRNSASTYGQAVVKFAVRVVTKNANNIISTTADTYSLTKSAPSVNIGAKSTYATTLKYSLVKEKDSTDEIKSADVTVDANGNLTYSGSNQGSVVVRISGNETVEALAPADKYVTVNYSNTKAASTLSVSDKELNLKPGDSQKIVASGSALTYKSSNEDVATVAQDGTVTAIKDGAAVITVTSPEDADHVEGQAFVTVLVSQTGDITATPEKVTGLKVSNKKGAYVSVKWASQGKNINYRVWKKVGNGKWVGKNVAGNKTTLSVKKGAKVQVKVKAYVKNAAGKTTWGPKATKAKTFKSDKK